MNFLTKITSLLCLTNCLFVFGMSNSSRFASLIPSRPTCASVVLTTSQVLTPTTSSSISANMALINMRGYQQVFSARASHNSGFQQNVFLTTGIDELAKQPKGTEIFYTRQQVIKTEFNQVLQTLRTAIQTPLNPAFNNSQGITRITHNWRDLSQLRLSNPTLNGHLQDLVKSIQQATTDSKGVFNPLQIYINGQEKTIAKAINDFEASLQSWRDDPTNIRLQALRDTQVFLQTQANSIHFQADNPASWRFLTDAQSFNLVSESGQHKELSNMLDLCKNGDTFQARELALKHRGDVNFFTFQAIHETHFAQQYTTEGIDLRFVNDTLYLAKKHELIKPHSTNLLSVPHQLNEQLAQRHAQYERIVKESSIKNPSLHTQQLIYQVITKEMSNPTAAISASKIFVGLNSFQTRNPSQQASVAMGTSYLQKGLSADKNAENCLKFAHEIQLALHNPQADQRILTLSDYTQALKESRHAKIQESIISFVASKLDSKNWDAINRVDRAYREMKAGDIQAEFYLRETFKAQVNEHVISQAHNAPMPHFAGINQNAIAAHVQENSNTTKVLLQNGAEIRLQQYQVPHSVVQFLVKNGLDPKKYTSCNGNGAQQSNHIDILKQVAKQHDLSGLKLIESSNLHQLLYLSTQVSDASREYNAVGNIMQSSALSHFCWQMVSYIENAAKFGLDTTCSFGQGTYKGLNNFAYTATHPQELLYSFRDLVFGMAKVMHANAVLEEKFSILKPLAQNEQIIREYTKQFEPIFQEIQERAAHATFQDFVREGTTLTIDGLLTKHTLGTIGKIAKVVKSHGEQLVQAVQKAKAPEIIARTIEGLEVRVVGTQASENAVFRNNKQTFKNTTLREAVASHSTIQKNINWTNHGFKHFPQKGLSWNQIVESTKQGTAKYRPGISIEALERTAWEKGIPTTNQKPWKVMKCESIIGAKNGIETSYMRIEISANTIHGHPITYTEYLELLNEKVIK